jgi:hypothetical protein
MKTVKRRKKMKKLVVISTLILISTLARAQTSAIDDIFERYSEKEGFSTVFISGKMLGLFTGRHDKGENGKEVVNRLTAIRILSVTDSILNWKLNFYTDLSPKINLSAYEELMVTKEGRNVTKFLIRQKGDVITELLMISGGPGNNALISITGDLDLKSLSELSDDTGIDELKDLDEVGKKKD